MKRFFLLLTLLLSPCLQAQGLMESAELIVQAQLKDDLRQAHQDELKALRLASITMSGDWQLPEGQFLSGAEVAELVDACLAQRAEREALEAKCPSALAERLRDEYEPAKMSFYARLQPSLKYHARDASYVEQVQRLLPEGMPDEQERTRLRDAIAQLVAHDFDLQSQACKLLAAVMDEQGASACAQPFLVLMQESQTIGPKLMACEGRWLTKEDKELIASPFSKSSPSIYTQLYSECQRLLAADCFGSEALKASFAQLRIAPLSTER